MSLTFCYRLYQLLEGEDKKQLFKTYKNLQKMAQKLMQDCAAAQHQLAVSSQEESLMLSKLDSDVNALHDALFCGGNQLLFSSRVCLYVVTKIITFMSVVFFY